MCFMVAAYKELELLRDLQLEVLDCHLRMLEYGMQPPAPHLFELLYRFVQGCHQSQGWVGTWGAVAGCPASLFGEAAVSPQQPMHGNGKGGAAHGASAPRHIQAPLRHQNRQMLLSYCLS